MNIDPTTCHLAQVLADRYGTHSGIFQGNNSTLYLEPIKPNRKYVWRTKVNEAAPLPDEEVVQTKKKRLCICGAMKKSSQVSCWACFKVLSEETKDLLCATPARLTPPEVRDRALAELTAKMSGFLAELESGVESKPQEMETLYERYFRVRFWANRNGKVSSDDWEFFMDFKHQHLAASGVHYGRVLGREEVEEHLSKNLPSISGGGFSNQR